MSDLNQCQFIGRLGKDPEQRFLPSGGSVASFSIATSEKWKDKNTGEKQERTEWVNVTAFNKLAEICVEYLKKGSQVYVSGKMQTDKYQAKDGTDRYSTKVVINQMQMLGGSNQQSQDEAPAQQQEPVVDDGLDDDIPFS